MTNETIYDGLYQLSHTHYDTYRVEPTWKKSVDEITTYSHPDYEDTIEVTENYRWGEFDITPTTAEELDALLNHDDDEFLPYDFEDCELVELWDCCSRDVDSDMDEDDLEALAEESEEFIYLEDIGWSADCVSRINGDIKVEKIDD